MKTLNKKNIFTFTTFSTPVIIKTKTNIIASNFFIYDYLDLDLDQLRENLKRLRIKKLIIYDLYENINDINNNGNYSGLIPKILPFDLTDFSPRDNSDYTYQIIPIHINEFFKIDFYTNHISRNRSKESIFLFRNIPWFSLCTQFFIIFKIHLSGGTKDNRHILSPTELRLANFINCLGKMRTMDVNDSFNITKNESLPKEETNKIFDYDNDKAVDRILNPENKEMEIKKNNPNKKVNNDLNTTENKINDSNKTLTNPNNFKSNENNTPFSTSGQKREYHTIKRGKNINKELIIQDIKKLFPNTNIKDLFDETDNIYKHEVEILSEFRDYLYNNFEHNNDNLNFNTFWRDRNLNLLFVNKLIKEKYYNIFLNIHATDKLSESLNELFSLGAEFKRYIPEDVNKFSILSFKRYLIYLNNPQNPLIPFDIFMILKYNNQYYRNTSDIYPVNYNQKKSYHTLNIKYNPMKNYSTSNNSLFKLNSPLFKILNKIIITEPINNDTQLKIEKFLLNQYLESTLEKELKNKNEFVNILKSPLINKLNEYNESLIKLITNFKRRKLNDISNKIISKISTNFIVSILFGRILRIASNNGRYNKYTIATNIHIDIGKEIINKYFLKLYKEESSEKYTYSMWKENNKELVEEFEDPTIFLNIGSLLVGWLIELKLLKNKAIIISRIEKHTILTIDDILNEVLLNNNNLSLLALPNKLPMIVPPKSYNNKIIDNNKINVLGGYLLNDIEYTENLIKDKWDLAVKTKILKDNVIYDTVNYTSSIPFKININVLNFIINNYKKYDLIIDTEYIHPLEKKQQIENLKKNEKSELESFKSKRDLEQNILGIANIYQNISKIYFPIRLDFRGRLNCTVDYLKYQSNELAKALLLFYEGEKIYLSDNKSINFLKIFGANCFGNKLDKESFNNRIKWIDNNINNIKNFNNGKLISQAEEKLLFIAFCFEYNNYLNAINNKLDYFITHLPIQLDASCNGFQHLTLLIGDLALSKELNLSESKWEDKPKDFYSFISSKTKEFFKNELNNNNNLNYDEIESYEKLATLEVIRKLFKKAIMTIPYNASIFSIVNYIKDEFNWIDKDVYVLKTDPNIIFKEIDFQSLRKAMYIVLFNDQSKLIILLDYLKDIAKVSNELNIQIPWTLPTGLIVQQQYYATKKKKYKPYLYTKNLLNYTVLDKTKFNPTKQKRALMPNLVHSLDAASLTLVINRLFKNQVKQFYSIHDCFAVTCNNVGILMYILKSVYTDIYSNKSYIIDFNETFLNSIKKTYGDDCYDPTNNTITIVKNDEPYIIYYPDINKVIKEKNYINFKDSSYIIH